MSRPSKKDIEQSVFKAKKNKIESSKTLAENKTPNTESIYDKVGSKVDVLPADQIMAKFVHKSGQPIYFVKVNLNGELWNPNDSVEVDNNYRLARTLGQTPPYKMAKTNIKCFNNYLKFLQSKTPGYLILAQREFMS